MDGTRRSRSRRMAGSGPDECCHCCQYPIPVANGQLDIGNIGDWQHFHIGNILKTPRHPMQQMVGTRVPRVRNEPPTPRHPMRQMVGRARRARHKVPQTQHQRRTIADGSESRPYHANLPRWYFHFVLDLSLMRLIAASAAGARRLSHFIKCDSRGMSEESPRSPREPMAKPRCWIL